MTTAHAFLDGASIAADVFLVRPDYRALLLTVQGIIPGPSNEFTEKLLQEAETGVQKQSVELPHIAAWQQTYKAFGAKPKKFRNSLEALTRRVDAGLPRINQITDIYNAISVKHQIPLGGEDLDKYTGSPRLIRATGSEDFETTVNGEKVLEHPDRGEIVWCDDAGVTCRRWNWRQGPRTALSHETKNAIFILDALDPVTTPELQSAADELVLALQHSSPDLQVARIIIDAHGKTQY